MGANLMYKCWLYYFDRGLIEEFPILRTDNTVEQFVLKLPEGVYSTLRTVQKTKIFQFSFHLKRLVESYSLSKNFFHFDITKIREPLQKIINDYPAEEVRIRMHIPLREPEKCYIILEELSTPGKKAYESGVRVNTNNLTRNNPKAKLTSFIQKSEKIKKFCKANNLEESIILSPGKKLLEGLSSNFFAVQNKQIFTADIEVLSGATRDIILDEARKAKIEINYSPISYDQIEKIEEAFISSTSRGLLPVIKIDDKQVGNGRPGKITTFLLSKLNERMLMEAENII
ncbi:MAG: aminotransferase class IV [Anaerolineaceae bacterium]|nr:aminotransferase class IV [Anaerolineaceae bacterium]